ncbi:hypothetical protein GCM10010129_37390 [Streptomyces fumigatiscleroticus]|nr:hypothetical protein GCM10010129_37390 [Streptomyces fumigatiscleroticus]
MTPAPHPAHGPEELCAAGTELYRQALRDGSVRSEDVTAAPCLVDFGLLHPAAEDLDRLQPVAPVVALHRLLKVSEDRIATERRREARLTEVFEPLMRVDGRPGTLPETPLITVLSTKERISQAIEEAVADATDVLAIHPHTSHIGPHPSMHEQAFRRDQALLDRGGRIRTLYQHTLRYAPTVLARYELLQGDVEARTLDEVTERLIVLDRAVAFIPANADRSLALEVRHPALVEYFATTFDRLWRLATPMYPKAAPQPPRDGITPRQRAIAALLVEGHTDAVVADRLGMNIRTARVHIAKLATVLGSSSRAQLGYLIARSGILDRES